MPCRKPLRSPRLARKKRQRRSRKILLLSLFILTAIGWAAYGLSRPEFRLRSVEVVGASQVPADTIRERILQELSGSIFGFIPKSHTLLYPKAVLKASLLKEFPALSNVALSLQSLSSLRVFLYEREPRALWCASSGDCFFIDETGTLFAPADAGEKERYYRLLGRTAEVSLGTTVIEETRLAKLLSFLRKLEDTGFPPEQVSFKEQGELEVALRGKMRLFLREGEYERVLANLETLMAENSLSLNEDGALSASYIDLRYGNKIYFKPR